MIPVILTETVATALKYIRMVLTAKKYYDNAASTVSAIETIFSADDAKHRVVVGEHVLLFIVGDQVSQILLTGVAITAKERYDIVLTAISNYLSRRSSDDVDAVVTEFAFELGYAIQERLDNVVNLVEVIERYFSSQDSDYQAIDPLRVAMESTNVLDSVPEPHILSMLGVDEAIWSDVMKGMASGPIGISWTNYLASDAITEISFSRYSTLFGVLLAGAESFSQAEERPLVLTSGPDSFLLVAPGIVRGRTFIPVKESLPDDRSITPQMIQATGEALTRRKGYVYLAELKTWMHRDHLEVVPDPMRADGHKWQPRAGLTDSSSDRDVTIAFYDDTSGERKNRVLNGIKSLLNTYVKPPLTGKLKKSAISLVTKKGSPY